MNTRRLFKEDVYMTSAEAIITGLSYDNGNTVLTLDQTVFFPTGGGQSCDRGRISDYEVIDVSESPDNIFHTLKGKIDSLKAGDSVHLELDWEHRFDNMQRHCGEHILSGIFFELFGGVNRGFHMGEEYMTIDMSLEARPEFTKITWEMAKEAELKANEVIWNNLPVITRHFDTREEAENLPLRKALAFDEDITIVCVGDVTHPADCVACCGTHPATAGQVGLIKLYKVEVNKGMFRIYFEAGKRAFKQYGERFEVLTTLENRLSAGFKDLLQKYEAQNEKNRAVRDELYHLKKSVIAREIEDINKELTDGYVKKYDTLSVNDLLEIGKSLQGKVPGIAFLVHSPSNTVLLFSDTHNCGSLVKENANIYGGKGGGGKNNARALFTKEEYVDTFIDLITKHLK